MDKEKTITALNSLIEINDERIEGFLTAMNETKDPEVRKHFHRFIETSRNCREDLSKLVGELGGQPLKDAKPEVKFTKAKQGIRSILRRNRHKAVSLYKGGAGFAVDMYEQVINKNRKALGTKIRKLLNGQISRIKADHQA
jgi:uncharacterized protein (TIGR02284 family)